MLSREEVTLEPMIAECDFCGKRGEWDGASEVVVARGEGWFIDGGHDYCSRACHDKRNMVPVGVNATPPATSWAKRY